MYGASTPSPGTQMPIMGGQGPMTPASPTTLAAPFPSIMPGSNIPPDLEYLLPATQITVQVAGPGEGFAGVLSRNQYHILDASGLRMYFAADDTSSSIPYQRSTGPWAVTVFNAFGQTVMYGGGESRGLGRFACLGCPHGGAKVFKGEEPLGNIIAMGGACCSILVSWNITNGSGEPVLRLESPEGRGFWPLLNLRNGNPVGKITESRGGVYVVQFPPDLDVTLKATLLFVPFMLDMNYSEGGRNDPNPYYGYD